MKILSFERAIESFAEIAKNATHTVLIVIAGVSCSGKTYFANFLKALLEEDTMLIPLDNYFLDIDDSGLPHDAFGLPSFDEPKSYHMEEFKEDITLAISGNDIKIPDYDIKNNRRISKNIELH